MPENTSLIAIESISLLGTHDGVTEDWLFELLFMDGEDMQVKEYEHNGNTVRVRQTISEGKINLSFEFNGEPLEYQASVEIAVVDEVERIHGIDAIEEIVKLSLEDMIG